MAGGGPGRSQGNLDPRPYPQENFKSFTLLVYPMRTRRRLGLT